MKTCNYILLLLLTLGFLACNSESNKKYPVLDLLEYGVPIEITAPEGAEVNMADLGVMKDITVRKGDDYFLQIFCSEAASLDKIDLLDRIKTEVEIETQFFSKFILEEDNGFIYEKKIDDRINYDFRVVKLQGDVEYIFQTGLGGTYTQDQVKDMFNSVK